MKMQNPTCSNIRIRSAQDAHKIFYAVNQGLLQMVARRLDTDERSALQTGCVYTWEERGPHSELTGLGIERFTEGRRWSPSRVRDEFLFYYEKFVAPPEPQQPGSSSSGKLPPRDWDPLIKQTYSVWVDTEKGRRKWHLTAYFTQATVDRLGTVDDIPVVRDLVIPQGIFKSTRTGKNRNKSDEQARPADKSRSTSTTTRTYAPYPGPANPEPNPSRSHVQQEPQSLGTPYSEHLPYPMYCQPQDRSSPESASPVNFSQFPRTQTQEFFQYQPSLDISQTGCIIEASPKPQQYPKHTEESPNSRYCAVPHSPQGSPSSARWTHDIQQMQREPDYARRGANDIITQASGRNPHSTHRGYGSTSYAGSHSPTLTQNVMENPNYMINFSDADVSGSTYTPSPHLRPLPYPEVNPQERNSYLPPLHSVEAIQASVYAFTGPNEILIPIEDRKSAVGPNRDLAPLQSLARPCPYRREPLDDRTLRLLRPRD
ncbi:hypothetical protein M378DRAFT_161503 [Amanita muscaria Koide BX008]|uniref:cAMP-independent regulatory protein pac2 n=1 Tax=Amanita muscaria (strain Koide BX008) TaxID=946122 RepID=A0A0C2WVR8_AMAMK|nr:hypothetical protein M378DRAFT_161503 [Amanita muscaria Koide BX008]